MQHDRPRGHSVPGDGAGGLLALLVPRDWGDLTSLPPLLPDVPGLPENMIPTPLRGWIVDFAERASMPLDFIAVPAIVALSSLVGRNIGIHPKQQDNWLVVPNLWGAVIGRPGVMKSAAIAEALRPLGRLVASAI
ncbi:MAG: DUF3987 domain-containing protein, partial [Gammaproteobacteria bacterium]|nr:DUF3987 domain-containing protein [Gammaproteobacteria bacterium]